MLYELHCVVSWTNQSFLRALLLVLRMWIQINILLSRWLERMGQSRWGQRTEVQLNGEDLGESGDSRRGGGGEKRTSYGLSGHESLSVQKDLGGKRRLTELWPLRVDDQKNQKLLLPSEKGLQSGDTGAKGITENSNPDSGTETKLIRLVQVHPINRLEVSEAAGSHTKSAASLPPTDTRLWFHRHKWHIH